MEGGQEVESERGSATEETREGLTVSPSLACDTLPMHSLVFTMMAVARCPVVVAPMYAALLS